MTDTVTWILAQRMQADDEMALWKEVIRDLEGWSPERDTAQAMQAMALFYAQGKLAEVRREREALRIVLVSLEAISKADEHG